MALSVALNKRHGVGGILVGLVTLTFSGSYATGGEAVDFTTTLGYTNRKPDMMICFGLNGYEYQYDRTNNKIVISTTAAAELGAGAYPAGVSSDTQIRALIIYIGTPSLN
jgi:hypothetical protein